MQGGFGGGMECGWIDVRYRFLIPTSPQYIDRFFLYLTQKNHLEHFRLSHRRTLAVSYTPVPMVGGPVIKSVKFFLLQMPFLELYHVYIYYMTSHIQFG